MLKFLAVLFLVLLTGSGLVVFVGVVIPDGNMIMLGGIELTVISGVGFLAAIILDK